MNQFIHWKLLYTRPGCEGRVAAQLEKRGMQCFIPLTRRFKGIPGRSKMTTAPLLKSYVFVKPGDNLSFNPLRVNGVIGYVYWLNTPVGITDTEMNALRLFLQNSMNVQVDKIAVQLQKHELVYGPIMTQKQVVEVVPQTIQLRLNSIGFAFSTRLNSKIRETQGRPTEVALDRLSEAI